MKAIPWEGQEEIWSELSQVSSVAAMTLEERFEYEEKLRNYYDYNAVINSNYQEGMRNGLKAGEETGFKNGKEAGIKDGKEAVARRLLSIGMDKEKIAEITELPVGEIEKLL